MAEPENHTLRLLREFREEFRAFRDRTDGNFQSIRERLENIRQAGIGEGVLGRYAAAEVDERLEAIEKRLAALEDTR